MRPINNKGTSRDAQITGAPITSGLYTLYYKDENGKPIRFYVGRTTDNKNRLTQHRSDILYDDSPKSLFGRNLENTGVQWYMDMELPEDQDIEIKYSEKWLLIKYIREGHPLTNRKQGDAIEHKTDIGDLEEIEYDETWVHDITIKSAEDIKRKIEVKEAKDARLDEIKALDSQIRKLRTEVKALDTYKTDCVEEYSQFQFYQLNKRNAEDKLNKIKTEIESYNTIDIDALYDEVNVRCQRIYRNPQKYVKPPSHNNEIYSDGVIEMWISGTGRIFKFKHDTNIRHRYKKNVNLTKKDIAADLLIYLPAREIRDLYFKLHEVKEAA